MVIVISGGGGGGGGRAGGWGVGVLGWSSRDSTFRGCGSGEKWLC